MNKNISSLLCIVPLSAAFLHFSISKTSAQTTQGLTNAPMSQVLKIKVQTTRQQVLDNNPALKNEETSLLAQIESLKHPNPKMDEETMLSIHQQWVSHENSVRAAAIKIDPTLAPYF